MVRLTNTLTESLTLPGSSGWKTRPMTTRTQPTNARRWVLVFLAALVAVLATILSSASASAATTGTAETRVRASSVVAEVPVGPPQRICAGQRLGEEPSRVVGVVATGVAANGGAAAVRTGQAGERAVQGAFQIGEKTPFNVLGRDRIADGMTETTISEVKNVAYQGYTQQLKDYVTYSIDHGLQFDLYVRRGTTLSRPLEEAIGLGQINRMYIP
jgi:hypothetical protein